MHRSARSTRQSSRRPLALRRRTFQWERLEERQMMSATPSDDLQFYSHEQVEAAGEFPLLAEFLAGGGDHIDPTGGVLDETPLTPAIPAYSSLPGAPAKLYLDFDGHAHWEHIFGDLYLIETPAFDMDGNPSQWSIDEVRAINEIWAKVAEDYSPFNINVTTVDPGDFSEGSGNLRVLIGGTDFRVGENAGGTARINAFSSPDLPNIAFVFPFDKFDGTMNAVPHLANTASHEAAHAFGVWHQSKWNGSEKIAEYNPGEGGRVPIMGDHGEAQAVWWRGTNSEGDFQDDMAVIARGENGFGYRPDDHSNGLTGASSMNMGTATFSYNKPDGSGSGIHVVETRGVLIASGVIEKSTDLDKFRFETGGGNVVIRFANPKIPGIGSRAGDLHAAMRLFDASGALIVHASDVFGTDFPLFELYLPAGAYYVDVHSFGNVGDVGQYRITVAEDAGPRMVASEFVNLGGSLVGLLVTFDEPIHPATFTIHDVRIGNNPAGNGVIDVAPKRTGEFGEGPVDPRRFLVTLAPLSTARTNVAIGPNITDQFGNLMDQNQNGVEGELNDHALALYLSENATETFLAGPAFKMYFDEAFYRQQNPDVAAAVAAGAFASGYDHFIDFGHLEGRRFSPFLENNAYYDEAFYLAQNPDVAAAVAAGAFASGLDHFALFGQREGRRFSRLFDEQAYLEINPDVAAVVAAGGLRSGYEHFVLLGAAEGRATTALFDEALYLEQNPDVAAAVAAGGFATGFQHFLQFGRHEGRRYSQFYNEAFYLAHNPDVAQAVEASAFHSGYDHFVAWGQFEGRLGVA